MEQWRHPAVLSVLRCLAGEVLQVCMGRSSHPLLFAHHLPFIHLAAAGAGR